MSKNTEQSVPACLASGPLACHFVPAAQDSPSLLQKHNSSLKETVSFSKEIQREKPIFLISKDLTPAIVWPCSASASESSWDFVKPQVFRFRGEFEYKFNSASHSHPYPSRPRGSSTLDPEKSEVWGKELETQKLRPRS